MPPRVRWSSVAGRLPLPVACARAGPKDLGLLAGGGGTQHAAARAPAASHRPARAPQQSGLQMHVPMLNYEN